MARKPKQTQSRPPRKGSRLGAVLKWIRPSNKLKVTFEGKIFILLTLGVGLAAINTGNNMLFLVLGFMLSLIIVSGIVSEITLHGLEITRKLPTLPWAGEIGAVEISVKNNKRIPSFCIEVQDIASNFTIDRRCFFLKISGKKTQSTAYHCVFPRRGIYHFSGMLVMSRFPFSLFSKSYTIEDRDDLIVAPHRVQVTTDIVRPVEAGEMLPGPKADRNDLEMINIRPYHPGDDLRRVNWKLSAHLGKLVVAEGMEHNQKVLNLIFDEKLQDGGGAGLGWPAVPATAAVAYLPPLAGGSASGGSGDGDRLAEIAFEQQVDLAASTAEAFAMKDYNLWLGTRRKCIGPLTPQQVVLIILELATLIPLRPQDAGAAAELPAPPRGPVLNFNRAEPGFAIGPRWNSGPPLSRRIRYAP